MATTTAVVGGRGKTGRAVAAAVAASGGSTRLMGRVELQDPVGALHGCDAVYVIAPNMHPEEAQYVGAVVDAARKAGVGRLVYHSVAAPYEPALPHHLGKAEAEVLVRRSGLRWTILQPGVYMQNFFPALTVPEPELVVPYEPDREFTFVDLMDVGKVAAAVLAHDDLIGATLEIGGPRTMTIEHMAADASAVLARRVPVRRISEQAWEAGVGQHVPARERRWLQAMFSYYSHYGLRCGSMATQTILGRHPTDFTEALAREVNK